MGRLDMSRRPATARRGIVSAMRQLLAAPPNNERSPRYMEKALAAIHQANRRRAPIILEYGSGDGQVGLYLRYPGRLAQAVAGPIQANYPRCSLQMEEEQTSRFDSNSVTWSAEVMLVPELFPILRHAQFEDLLNGNFADPINSLLQAIQPIDTVSCRIEFHITPATASRSAWAAGAVRRLDRPFFRRHEHLAHFYTRHITRLASWPAASLFGMLAAPADHPHRAAVETSAGRHHEREEDLQAASEKMSGHLFETRLRLVVAASPGEEAQAVQRIELMAGALGAFTRSRLAVFRLGPVKRGVVHPLSGRGFLLSHEELATLWHPPTATVVAERMQSRKFAELEAPLSLHQGDEQDAVPVGLVHYRDDRRPFGLKIEDRRRHLYVVGKTGMGKTTLLLNLLTADLSAGRGLCLIDPHGDLAETLVRLVPKHRTNDVILFDAGDKEYAVAFNPLACPDPARIDQVTSGVVAAFKKLYDSWGPRLEDTLRNATFATVEQGGTLLSLMRLLADEAYRGRVVPQIQDSVVRAFWQQEFACWNDRYRTEAVAAIQNKIRPFLTNTSTRAIVSQPGRSLDLREIMDAGQVLIVNLSKGRVGEDNATLLGAFLVTSIQQAAMTRADVSEEHRRDFFLYIDEFQNFTTGSLAAILSEARKYRLSLTVAHQYLKQLNGETADAIFGNVGSMIAFQVGSEDAAILSEQFSKFPGQLQPQDLTNIPKYSAYARLLIDGMPGNPFSMTTFPPPVAAEDRYELVYRRSLRQYARPQQAVHHDIDRELSYAATRV